MPEANTARRRKSRLAASLASVGMDELYRDQILEHYKRPHNFGVVEGADREFEDTNPFCGDEKHVTIKLDSDDKVSEVAFEGKGGAITPAAPSLLTDELVGQLPQEGGSGRADFGM